MKKKVLIVRWLVLMGLGLIWSASTVAQTPGPEKSTELAETRAAEVLQPKGLGLPLENDLLLARQRALTLAGAFANEGYRLRDAAWSRHLAESQPAVLALWLFARNAVWLSSATVGASPAPQVEVFGADGRAVEAIRHSAPGITAVGFIAPRTGWYYIRARVEGPTTAFCLVYSYK